MPLNPTEEEVEEMRRELARRAEENYWVRRGYWLGTAVGSSFLAVVIGIAAIVLALLS